MNRTLKRTLLALTATLTVGLVATTTVVLSSGGSDQGSANARVEALRPSPHYDTRSAAKIVELIQSNDVLGALGIIAKLRDSRQGDCHAIVHLAGRTAWEHFKNVAVAFRAGNDICDFGYYHGIVEAAGSTMTEDEFVEKIPVMCAELEADGLRHSQCAHGSGHGAFYQANGDMDAAMELCRNYANHPTEGQGFLDSCETGVSMEWFSVHYFTPEKVTPRVTDPREVCPKVKDKFQDSCYEYVFNGTSNSYEKMDVVRKDAAWCHAKAGKHLDACLTSLARAGLGQVYSKDVPPNISPVDYSEICTDDPKVRLRCMNMAILLWGLSSGASTVPEYDALCAQLKPIDRAPGGACIVERAQVLRTWELGASDAAQAPGKTVGSILTTEGKP